MIQFVQSLFAHLCACLCLAVFVFNFELATSSPIIFSMKASFLPMIQQNARTRFRPVSFLFDLKFSSFFFVHCPVLVRGAIDPSGYAAFYNDVQCLLNNPNQCLLIKVKAHTGGRKLRLQNVSRKRAILIEDPYNHPSRQSFTSLQDIKLCHLRSFKKKKKAFFAITQSIGSPPTAAVDHLILLRWVLT